MIASRLWKGSWFGIADANRDTTQLSLQIKLPIVSAVYLHGFVCSDPPKVGCQSPFFRIPHKGSNGDCACNGVKEI